MTVDKLRDHIFKLQLEKGPISYLEVDADTYGHACQAVFNNLEINALNYGVVNVSVGVNMGLMFKGIELILVVK